MGCTFQWKTLEVIVRDLEGRQMYEVDLERCNDAVGLLDSILQVNNKIWCTPEMLKSLIDEIDRACREVFGRGIQGTFCAFDSYRQVDWKRKVSHSPVAHSRGQSRTDHN